jgi:phosphate:Na+ symporter
MIPQLLGGIGLFLLGMLLLTDGLKAAAGEALKRILIRFTGRSITAFLSGFTVTAMVQSSSATTLATIGFVSAGLLSVSQAVGVIIGGSVGTTTTGWIVSLLGIKLSVGKLALPLIGVGAFMRLVLKGTRAQVGLALAGFGLIFVGIDTLQEGMAILSERIRPEDFPDATLLGRLLLVLIGVVLTVVMQSSSAAIATTITAFHTGTIHLEQALSLVIGASIGTTVTAGLASIGASVPAKRTALSHVLFNSFAGGIGFLLEPLFAWGFRWLDTESILEIGAISLAVFHTAFHLIGALIVLPVVDRLSALVNRLVPDRGPVLTRYLDESLVQVPEIAVEAVRRTLADSANELFDSLLRRLEADKVQAMPPLGPVRSALDKVRIFLGKLPSLPSREGGVDARLAVVHALDHLDQLVDELARSPSGAAWMREARVELARDKLREVITACRSGFQSGNTSLELGCGEKAAGELAEIRRKGREILLIETAYGGLPPEKTNRLLEAMRWMDTTAYHTWRVTHHLLSTQEKPKESIEPVS